MLSWSNVSSARNVGCLQESREFCEIEMTCEDDGLQTGDVFLLFPWYMYIVEKKFDISFIFSVVWPYTLCTFKLYMYIVYPHFIP